MYQFCNSSQMKTLLNQIWLYWATDFCHLFDAVFYERAVPSSLLLDCFSSFIYWVAPRPFHPRFHHLFHFRSIRSIDDMCRVFHGAFCSAHHTIQHIERWMWCAIDADLVNVTWIHFARKDAAQQRNAGCGKMGRLLRQSVHSNFMSVNSNETP